MGVLGALAASGAVEGDAAKEVVFDNDHLVNVIFGHLRLEDLCSAAMVRRSWRAVTANPSFWTTINLKGRTVMVSKVTSVCFSAAGLACACMHSTHQLTRPIHVVCAL
jgi:hypothetical protein